MPQVTSEALASAVNRLRAGGVVAFPTETVYGLGADALNHRAVHRVYELKGRPAQNPLIVHVSDQIMARAMCDQWTTDAARLAERFWPGPLTLVLPKSPRVPDVVTAGGPGVAVRCPAHPLALALIEGFAGPIVGPSANLSGMVSPTAAAHVRAAFGDEDVMVLDGGACRAGIESTVLSLFDAEARLLRRGVVSAAEIEAVLQRPVTGPPDAQFHHASDQALPSPGMLARHYAPRTPASLYNAPDLDEALAMRDTPAVVLAISRTAHVEPPHVLIRMPLDARDYAARLYAALHEADDEHTTRILIEQPTAPGELWDALRDRLSRATA